MLQNKKLIYIIWPMIGGYLFITFSGALFWYDSVIAISFAANKWLFCVLWIAVYLSMGWAAYKSNRYLCIRVGNLYYYAQLLLSYLWMITLFRWDVKIAFAMILLQIGFALCAMREYYHFYTKTGYIMLPCVLWYVYMAILNFTICTM